MKMDWLGKKKMTLNGNPQILKTGLLFFMKNVITFFLFWVKMWSGHVVMGLTQRQINPYVVRLFVYWHLLVTERIFFKGNQSEDAVHSTHKQPK